MLQCLFESTILHRVGRASLFVLGDIAGYTYFVQAEETDYALFTDGFKMKILTDATARRG